MGRPRYSYRRAFESGAFSQNDLVDDSKFGSMATDRGFPPGLGSRLRKQLERLDQAGALRPVAFVCGGYRGGTLVFREDTEFAPWESYEALEDGVRRMRALYTPWQLLYLKQAVDLSTARVSVEWLLDTSKRRRLGRGARHVLESQAERWHALDDWWRIGMLLLVRIQNRYLPSVRGTLTTSSWRTPYDPKTGAPLDHNAILRDFDPKRALRDLGVKAVAVKNMHHRLVTLPAFDDPLDDWQMLVRMTPYEHRQKLKGDALRAQDAYDAAEMLRHLYYHLTGDFLPQPDEVFDLSGGSWREQVYGHGPRLNYTRHDLKAELQRLGIYPHLVHLVVEGDTERILFERLIGSLGIDPAERGVSISTFRGVGQHELRQEILHAARTYSRFPVLISDREGGIEQEVRALQENGLLAEDSTFLWKASLEEDNFTHDELVELAQRAATKQGGTLKLTGRTLKRKHHERRSRAPVGLAEVLLDLAASPRHGYVRISKTDLAEEMANLLSDEIRATTVMEQLGETRPVIGILLSILRVT